MEKLAIFDIDYTITRKETLMEFFPEKYVVKYMRSHLAGYLSGKYKNSTALVSVLKMEKYSEIVEFLTKIIV